MSSAAVRHQRRMKQREAGINPAEGDKLTVEGRTDGDLIVMSSDRGDVFVMRDVTGELEPKPVQA